jgi:hypothetical protein
MTPTASPGKKEMPHHEVKNLLSQHIDVCQEKNQYMGVFLQI